MKILIAGQAFYQHNNGQAVFTINLAEGLARANHQVMVVAPSEQGRPYRKEQNGVVIQTVPTLPLQYTANITAFSDQLVAKTLADFAPEIVHIQDHYFVSRSVLRGASNLAVKRIGTNCFLPENLMENLWLPTLLRNPMKKWLWYTMLQVFNQLDSVTAPTPTAVAILKEVGLEPPVQAISCGVDSWQFRPRPELKRGAICRNYGLRQDKTRLLFVGRVDHEKCLDLVIRALALLARADLQFVIAGQGSHQTALRGLVDELGLGDRVVFTGFIPEADLPRLFNSVDAFIMPSAVELQSIATLEAMASGLPILAANACALPELVTHGSNGFLFAPNDIADTANTIAEFMNHKAHWSTMTAASLEKVKIHTADSTIHRYLDWYQQTQPAKRPVGNWQLAKQLLNIGY